MSEGALTKAQKKNAKRAKARAAAASVALEEATKKAAATRAEGNADEAAPTAATSVGGGEGGLRAPVASEDDGGDWTEVSAHVVKAKAQRVPRQNRYQRGFKDKRSPEKRPVSCFVFNSCFTIVYVSIDIASRVAL